MHKFRSIRRVDLGVAVAGATIGAVPALASASSTCVYHPNIKELNVTDGSGAQPLRIVRESAVSPFITLDDGVGTRIFCPGAGGTFAQIDNTDQIDISGPITNTTDGYVIDESGGRPWPGATLEPTGGSEIEVVAFTDGGVRGSLEVRGGTEPDVYKVGGTGSVDKGGDGDADFSITAGANTVKLVGAEGADTLTGRGFGSTGPASVRVVLDGGANNDTLVGGNAGDQFLGGSGSDTLGAVDNHLDVISGGPDFDVANVDRDFDVFIDGVERINKINAVGRLRLAPRLLTATVGKTARLQLSWKHPKNWRELRKVQMKVYRGEKAVAVVDARPGRGSLSSTGAVELMSGSTLGHHGKWVTAKLAVRLAKSLAGETLRVDVKATDMQGHRQLERDAGTIRVAN
jgi:hypothetical protein